MGTKGRLLALVGVVAIVCSFMRPGGSAEASAISGLTDVRQVVTTPPGAAERVARGRVVVKFRGGDPGQAARSLAEQGVREIQRVGTAGARVVEVEPGREVETARRLAQLPTVEYAEPDYVVTKATPLVPTDPLYGSGQQDLVRINMPDAWGVTIGLNTLRVAVLDSGITASHPDLATQWAYAPGRSAEEHVFLSTPLSTGCSVPTSPVDDDGHGTHVSGTIAAASTLSGAAPVGIAGMAPGVRVMPVKVLDCQGSGYLSDVANAIAFAAQTGAAAISLSLGGGVTGGCPSYLQDPINVAVGAGVFIAAAAGNDGSTSTIFPAGCAGVASIAATNNSDGHPSFSNRNNSVFLSAPGVGIQSTWLDGGYFTANGTSMATPHVAACAALIRSAKPSLGAGAIASILQSTAVDLGTPGYDTTFGWGRINCGAAVSAASGVVSAGGRGLSVTTIPNGVSLAWQSGIGQTGYGILRLVNGVVSVLPVSLGPTATGFVDVTAPPGLVCYAILPLGTTPQAQSDALCANVGFHTATGHPRSFTLQLNQSSTASLSWATPSSGQPDNYLLLTVGGSLQTLPPTQTTINLPAIGGTCYVVGATRAGALLGYSDMLCGIPGFSNLGAGA